MKKVTEKFVEDKLKDELRKDSFLKKYKVSTSENLRYKVIVDCDGNYFPESSKLPKRGQLAFQTDILIKKHDIPLVVIEVKANDFSTHDVLTYSTKAVKHKEVYPYLRYGFVVGNSEIISNKFFTHNVGFDFALAINNLTELSIFTKIIRSQVRSAEQLLKLLKEKNQTQIFTTKIEVKRVKIS